MDTSNDTTAPESAVNTNAGKRQPRRTQLFPAASFEEALTIPNAIQKFASGEKVRRITLFHNMEKSPDSGASRQLCINSHKYGLTTGSYSAEFLALTQEGKLATSSETPPRQKLAARFKLAIQAIPPFMGLYESLKGNRLPASTVLEDQAKELRVPEPDVKECVQVFIVNAKFLGILKTMAGAERILPIEQALEELPESELSEEESEVKTSSSIENLVPAQPKAVVDHIWDNICFYISPIGDEDSEHRKHSDLFLGSVVEPALEEFKLRVVRADKIGKPGMISKQIIEYILKSKLVIADLSFHNPNVFYELALRHVCRLPTVQIIRKCDKIPFDLENSRTIAIDTTDIYSMVPNLQTYKAEISMQVRMALKDPDTVDNPLGMYYPSLRANF